MRHIFMIDLDEGSIIPGLISGLLIQYFQKMGYQWRPHVRNITCKAILDVIELIDNSDPKTRALYFTPG